MIEIGNIAKQIAELNDEVKCTLAPSKIHGIGVFALRDIKKGEQMFCAFNPRQLYTVPYANFSDIRPEIRELILQRYCGVLEGGKFQSPNDDQLLTSFMNHSDTPSYDQATDSALRDIRKGEEVFEDYRILCPRYAEIYPFIK